jgi:hypothetical protein
MGQNAYRDVPESAEDASLKQKEMKKLTLNKKTVWRVIGVIIILSFVYLGVVEFVQRVNAAADHYSMERVRSNPALKAQFVQEVRTEVEIPVVKTEDLQKAVDAAKDGAKQGAIEGTDAAIQKQLK